MLARALFRGGGVGGLVAFVLQAAVWGLLPWHRTLTERFADEDAVAHVLASQACEGRGVYQLPQTQAPDDGGGDPAAWIAGLDRRLREGPVARVALRPEGLDLRNPAWFLNSLLIQLGGALGLTLLAWPLRERRFALRWAAVFGAAAVGGWLNQLPYWNWWHFSAGWTAVQLADLLLVWAGAGAVIAWAVGPAGRRFTALDAAGGRAQP